MKSATLRIRVNEGVYIRRGDGVAGEGFKVKRTGEGVLVEEYTSRSTRDHFIWSS